MSKKQQFSSSVCLPLKASGLVVVAIAALGLCFSAHAQLPPTSVAGDTPESWDFVLDGREWVVGSVGTYYDSTRREYVLKGEDSERFSEKIVTSRYPKVLADSLDAYVAKMKDAAALCPATKFTVVEQERDTVIFERNVSQRCDEMGVQSQIVKTVFRNGGALSFSYISKLTPLGPIARNKWIEMVKFATPK